MFGALLHVRRPRPLLPFDACEACLRFGVFECMTETTPIICGAHKMPAAPASIGKTIYSHPEFTGLVVAAGLYLIDMMNRLAINASKDQMGVCTVRSGQRVTSGCVEESFGVSGGTIGTACGSSFFYAYALAQIPVGMLVDAIGPRRLLTAAAALGTVEGSVEVLRATE